VPRPSVHRTLAVFGILRDREIRALWFADWISDVGSFVTFIALAVYVNQLTGSAVSVGIALALRSVPWFTLGPFAGVLADRLDRRAVMVWTNLARGALVALLPFTHVVWQAYALSFASSLLAPVFRPARSALLAQVAGERRLVPALVLSETTHQVLHTVGPAFGGLIVLLVGARSAFFVDAASFVVAASFVGVVRTRGRADRQPGTMAGDLREGIGAVVAAPAVRAWALLNAALYLGLSGVVPVLLVYTQHVLHRSGGTFGLILSVAGAGSVVASLAIAANDERLPRTGWALVSVVGAGMFAFAALRPPLGPLFAVAFVSGLCDTGAGIPSSTTVAEALPDAVRGRAYGAIQAFDELAAAIGSLTFAWLGDPHRLGPANGLALAAATGMALGIVVLVAGGARAIASSERARLNALRSG